MKTHPTKMQLDIMTEFYNLDKTKTIFNKSKRKEIWSYATKRDNILLESSFSLQEKCPALYHQVLKSYRTNKNIQSAVFSECVYAQTLANMFGLNEFVTCENNTNFIFPHIATLLKKYSLVPRYIYTDQNKTRMLIQAGGNAGIDSALITALSLNIYTIEFKEPFAKTSEPDLPKYGEYGKLITNADFQNQYPQFTDMLVQYLDKSIFDHIGKNIHQFDIDSINMAVSNNYVKKFADVCVTEDKFGYLTMLPLDQISQWAKIFGEIRPAGRNAHKVWTPQFLISLLKDRGAVVDNQGIVTIKKENLHLRKQRGNTTKISAYKINPLFFVRIEHCQQENENLIFDIQQVMQLNPTIAGKVDFKLLDYNVVKQYYVL